MWDVYPEAMAWNIGAVHSDFNFIEQILRSSPQLSVQSWFELELAWAKKLELGWLGWAWRKGQNPSLAWLGLEIIFNLQGELSSGLVKVRFTSWAQLRLGGSEHFKLDPCQILTQIYKMSYFNPCWLKFVIFTSKCKKLKPAWAKKLELGRLSSAW